jgi:hypothetical protein
VRQIIPLVTSAATLWGIWLAGRKVWWAWLVGLGNQVLWLAFIVMFAAWGLLPLCVGLVIVYVRNHILWSGERRATLEAEPV